MLLCVGLTALVALALSLGFFTLWEQVPTAKPLSEIVQKQYHFDHRFSDFPTHSLDAGRSE